MNLVVDGVIYEKQSRGGASRIYDEVLPRLCGLDDQVEISLLTEGNVLGELPEHDRIRNNKIPSVGRKLRRSRLTRPLSGPVRNAIRRFCEGDGKGRIWHSTYYTMPVSWKGAKVITLLDMVHERFEELFELPEHKRFSAQKRRCVEAADVVLCISESVKRDVIELYGGDTGNLHVLHLACGEMFIRETVTPPSIALGRPYILYVGRTVHYKNFDMLANAYSRWSQRNDFDLVIVGAGSAPDLSCDKTGIRFMDNVTDEQLSCLYRGASAFVYPSLYEGFGIPLLEAMACKCPIVASRIPSSEEIALDCPVFFEPSSPDDLIASLDKVVSEGRNSDRVARGADRAKHFTWDRTAQHLLDAYKSIEKNL